MLLSDSRTDTTWLITQKSTLEADMQDFDIENQLATQRYQQALAEQNKPLTSPQGRMVGDIYVRSNPLQSLIQGLRMKQAKDELGASRQELKDLRTKRQETETRDMSAFVDLLRDKPAVASTTTPTQMPSFDDADAQSMQGIQGYGATTGAQAARPGDPMAAYSMAAASQSPTLRKVGLEGTMSLASEQAKQRTAQAQQDKYMAILDKVQDPQAAIRAGVPASVVTEYYKAKDLGRSEVGRTVEVEGPGGVKMIQQLDKFGAPIGQLMPGYMPAQAVNTGNAVTFAKPVQGQSFDVNMSPGDKARLAQSANQFQQSQANRPERMVSVLGPNGEAITVPQSQSQGLPLYNPQAAASLQKEKTKGQAKEQLSGVVQQLNNSYTALEQGGGITSTAQGGLSNLGARLGSTGFGQAVGGALGTANQRQRQEIEQTRPLLLNLIKDATGMTASQMNSNAEMQLYLKAATDPTLTVEANRSALANLDKMFGLGIAKPPADAAKTPAGGANPQDAEALKWARSNPNDPRSKTILQRLGQ